MHFAPPPTPEQPRPAVLGQHNNNFITYGRIITYLALDCESGGVRSADENGHRKIIIRAPLRGHSVCKPMILVYNYANNISIWRRSESEIEFRKFCEWAIQIRRKIKYRCHLIMT